MTQPTTVRITSLPEELLDQIIQSIPVSDLSNIMFISRAFYRQARAHLYRSVCYPVQSIRMNTQLDCTHLPLLIQAESEFYSAATITKPYDLLTLIEKDPSTTSLIHCVSFLTQTSQVTSDIGVIERLLSILTPKALHLALADGHKYLALMSTVTCLDIVYPVNDREDWITISRDEVYPIFAIPSLRDLTLRDARSWCAFIPIPDDERREARVSTSNVTSLSLRDTVPMDSDLQEILTWPKDLRCFRHESIGGVGDLFQSDGRGKIASAARFLQGILSQRESLEELSYNHGCDRRGDDASTFDQAQIKSLVKLKHLSVPYHCFVDGLDAFDELQLYTVLPPHLEALYLDLDDGINDAGIYDPEHEAPLRNWLHGILDNRRTHLPMLVTLILWQESYGTQFNHSRQQELAILDRLAMVPAFADAGIRLDFVFT